MTKKDVTKKEQTEIKNNLVNELKDQVLNDLEKEIKTTIKNDTMEYKKDLQAELLETVNNEITLAVKREEKRLLRSKNITILKKNIIIIILLGLIIYLGYCLYDVKYFKFFKSTCENQNNNLPVKETENNSSNEIIKDKAWYLKNYSYLLDVYHLNLSPDNINAYYIYSGNHEIKDLKYSYLLNIAYNNLKEEKIKVNDSIITISSSDLKEIFLKIFDGIEYIPTNFTYNCLNFIYEEDEDNYIAQNKTCESSTNEIMEIIDNIYEQDEKIYIETFATLYNETEKSCYSFDNLFNPLLTNISKEEINENNSKLNKYLYEYKLINDTYYLEKISKVK